MKFLNNIIYPIDKIILGITPPQKSFIFTDRLIGYFSIIVCDKFLL